MVAQLPCRKNRSGVRPLFAFFGVSWIVCLAPAVAAEGDRGVTDEVVVFGQSACFTGPNGHLGVRLRAGIEAAF